MTLGPLEGIAIGFEGNHFNGEIARETDPEPVPRRSRPPDRLRATTT